MANEEISILTLSLRTNLPDAQCKAYIQTACNFGLSLIDTGADVALAGRIRTFVADTARTTGLLGSCACSTPAELSAWIEAAGFSGADALAVRVQSADELERLHTNGVFAAGRHAKNAGTLGSVGVSLPADPELIRSICETVGDIDFIRIPLNILLLEKTPRLREAVRFAGECELSVLASDPFAGGKLVPVPAEAHEAYRTAPVPRSHEEWALRAVWEMQEVATVTIEPANDAQFQRACVFAETGRANSLPLRELAVLEKAAHAFPDDETIFECAQQIY
ncbi:MAG TPA: hypothetical protein PK408_05060 [Treponemataceae bacterium]|nr:hypothetical protein [Treponemataceae bacterium]